MRVRWICISHPCCRPLISIKETRNSFMFECLVETQKELCSNNNLEIAIGSFPLPSTFSSSPILFRDCGLLPLKQPCQQNNQSSRLLSEEEIRKRFPRKCAQLCASVTLARNNDPPDRSLDGLLRSLLATFTFRDQWQSSCPIPRPSLKWSSLSHLWL